MENFFPQSVGERQKPKFRWNFSVCLIRLLAVASRTEFYSDCRNESGKAENCNFRRLPKVVQRSKAIKLTIIKIMRLIERKKFTAHEIRLVTCANKFGNSPHMVAILDCGTTRVRRRTNLSPCEVGAAIINWNLVALAFMFVDLESSEFERAAAVKIGLGWCAEETVLVCLVMTWDYFG